MKAVILLGTLKKDGLSNTATLSEFLAGRMIARSVETIDRRKDDRPNDQIRRLEY